MSRVNNGRDIESRLLAGVFSGATGTGGTVTYTATTMVDSGASFPASSGGPPETGGLVGLKIVSGTVTGTILKNTATTITVDLWAAATTPTVAGSTPSSSATYVVTTASCPAWYLGISTATRAIAGADAFLTNDGSTISEVWNAGGGLNRTIATTIGHTLGTTTYTLQKTFVVNGSDPGTTAVNRVGIFQHYVTAAPTTTTSGQMFFEDDVSSPPTLVSGDSIAVTLSVTI